ncbi:hypothetical protein J4E89_004505 [Alternaria sp. Ai002NY15]|nr:hypothetical protein J4E89_004505 [Alternaria sp. Ai002NY15]
MLEIYERPGPPAPPAEDEDWPHGDGIPDDDVKSAIAAITHARQFWDKYEDPTSRKANQREKFYTSLDGHIARLEDVWEAVASYNAGNFSYTSRGTTMDTILREPETPSLWEGLIAEQEEKDENDDTMEPLHKLEQKLRRIALTGIHVGNLTKKHTKTEKAAGGPDIRKPVHASWSKDKKPLYRTNTGKGVLTLYETKQLTMTELQWFTMNYAVRDAAIAWRRKLLPDHADAARNMSQIIWKRRTDAEEHFAARLSDLQDFTRKANSSTVAYAAAYLDHFRTRAPNLTTMGNLEVDKFLVQFLKARVLRPEAGTDDD